MERRLLPALTLAAVLLGGCSTEDGGDATESTGPTPSSSATAPGWVQIGIVTGTAAGGAVSSEPVRVDSEEAWDSFVRQFERSDLADRVVGAVAGASIPEGWVPAAAVIAIGCDVPSGIVVDTRDGLAVTAEKVSSPMQECLAPMTSVAVIAVDPALL